LPPKGHPDLEESSMNAGVSRAARRLIALCGMLGIGWAAAQSGSAGGAVADGDRRFVAEASAGGQAEVAAGQLAQQRAAHAQVREFAKRMVRDHTASAEKLKAIADAKGVATATPQKPSHEQSLKRLGELSGAEFDRAYMKQMVADHRKTITLFEQQSRSGRDPALKAYAEETLPTLREHLQHAQATEAAVGQGAPASRP
jgi:putative membrane protein